MAQILPFQGYRFRADAAGDVARLIAPPYDVIDPALRDTLWRLSPYNISRVTRADRDEKAPNPYDAAGKLWAEWLSKGILAKDAQPALYVYEQRFEVRGQRLNRTALIARVRLKPHGEGVLPHENTLSGPRADRLLLMRATETQFGQVFGLYQDPAAEVDTLLETVKRRPPTTQAADRQDLLHRLWAVTDEPTIARLTQLMESKDILIADGHPRYETSLAYMAEHPENEAAKWRMMALVNTGNPGLVILPIHRGIKNIPGFKPQEFLAKLRKQFDIKTYPGDTAASRDAALQEIREQQAAGRNAYVLQLNDGYQRAIILRDPKAMEIVQGHSDAWRRLDVAVLHHLILEPLLGITAERLAAESNVEYIHDFPHSIEEAAARVRSGASQALFLLNATRADEVQAVARNREKMPQKSTFFYPKVYTGMVVYRMKD